jgi:hypothetical protein
LKTNYYLLFAFLILSHVGFSQVLIKGKVFDKASNQPITNVIISYNFGEKQTVSDSLGRFKISINPESPVIFKKFGYSNFNLNFNGSKSDLNDLKVYLQEKPIELVEVDVNIEKLQAVIKNKSFYLVDYAILPNDMYLALSYKTLLKEFDVSIINSSTNKIYSRKTIKGEDAKNLFLDCFGSYHVVSDVNARQIVFDTDSSFSFLDAVPREKFRGSVEKCVSKIDQELFFNDKGTVTSFFYKVKDQKVKPMRHVTYNKEMREMYINEIRDERQKMRDGSYSLPYKSEFNREQWLMEQDRRMAEDQIFRPIYAPVFLKNDTMVLLNFPEMIIEYYNKEGSCIYKVPMGNFSQYHNFEAKYDPKTQKFYIFNQIKDKRYLMELNIYNGQLIKSYKLEKPFVHCLQVFNGDIYYIVREKEWDDTAYLYKQPM